MDTVQIRLDRDQLDAVIDALALAAVTRPADPRAAEWDKIGAWLAHRYTKRWGLPRRAAAAARQLNLT